MLRLHSPFGIEVFVWEIFVNIDNTRGTGFPFANEKVLDIEGHKSSVPASKVYRGH